jgi:hypothetical protein
MVLDGGKRLAQTHASSADSQTAAHGRLYKHNRKWQPLADAVTLTALAGTNTHRSLYVILHQVERICGSAAVSVHVAVQWKAYSKE